MQSASATILTNWRRRAPSANERRWLRELPWRRGKVDDRGQQRDNRTHASTRSLVGRVRPLKRLAVMLGDRYGVGPELVARLVSSFQLPNDVAGVIVGDPSVWAAGRAVSGAGDLPMVASFADAAEGWSFQSRPVPLATSPMGQLSAEAGQETILTLAHLTEAAKRQEIDGIVYGPLNKQAMKAAGHTAGDELDFFNSHLAANGLTGEINILDQLWTSRVTSHVPLGEVAPLITRERVRAAIELLPPHSLAPETRHLASRSRRSTLMRAKEARSARRRSRCLHRQSPKRSPVGLNVVRTLPLRHRFSAGCWLVPSTESLRCITIRGRSPSS